MRPIKKSQHAALSLPSLRLEGGLFLPDQVEKAALGLAGHQTEADYGTPKGLKLKDDYSRAFQIACAQWKHFAQQLDREDLDAAAVTAAFVQELLRDALGYANLAAIDGVDLGDRHYPITLTAGGSVPVVVAPHDLGLDDADPRFAIAGGGSRKKSAFQLAQEFLNASSGHLWALVSNGRQLRLLRDAATLTRPSFLEVDLEDLLGGQRFAEFAMAWRLLHASRAFPPGRGAGGEGKNIWESWRSAGLEEGTRVREGLRQGVTQALLTFGTGFIQHPGNDSLRQDLLQGRLSKEAYFQQLLRLVYRLIFLFTVEERGLLHAGDDSPEAVAARRAYAEGYGLGRLRDRCLSRRARTRFDDLWTGVRIVFRGLASGEPRLALPALGGLFAATQCPDLDDAGLTNASLLEAVKHLRWTGQGGSLAPVDYRNMGPEELGSVYESLLELVPDVDIPARRFGFIGLTSEGSTQGNARKTSGSYYTPDSLVQELIKSALDPVIEQRLQENPANPTEALLGIKVIDPACGSGHFLLAAARRLAERLAALRATDGAVRPQDYRHALREVVSRCLFGVDKNPMALELARTALWLEGFEAGQPLSFLDHHLQCGDALIGLTDIKQLENGIPDAAFKPLSGDDKTVCREIAKANKVGLNAFAKHRTNRNIDIALHDAAGLAELEALEALPDMSTADIAAKEAAYRRFLQHGKQSRLGRAANLLLGAFLTAKGDVEAKIVTPTSHNVYLELFTEQAADDLADVFQVQRLAAARQACEVARVLHWPLAFPQVFKQGGFDCVLGNPPWEMLQLDPQEFFASRAPDIANAKHMAARDIKLEELQKNNPLLYDEFAREKRFTESMQCFVHANDRYKYSGFGRINLYALFVETCLNISRETGRIGIITPSGIATDSFTQKLFNHINSGHLVSLYDFENREAIFAGVHRSYKFCLLTLGQAREAEFAFFLTQTPQLADDRRRFTLSAEDFARINPNTLTCPVFRSRRDAELTRKIYRRVPVLIREGEGRQLEHNPWGISFMLMFMMNTASHLFSDESAADRLPLYEAKMIHQFDHRWATYASAREGRPGVSGQAPVSSKVPPADKQNPHFTVTPRYWVDEAEVQQRLEDKGWDRGWLLGWRDICRATDERTVIASVVPQSGVGNQMPLIFPGEKETSEIYAALVANLSALVLDFVARHKVGGTHLNFFLIKQLPVLSPDHYTDSDLAFIVPRVLELTYTAWDLQLWAKDLGYDGEPFPFDPERRALLRAELDAWYARAYGLSRDELRYILDPADVMGDGYPSETFRVLKNNELKAFGEYRTRRLVLEAWDRLASGELSSKIQGVSK